jgi:hypothetical protein
MKTCGGNGVITLASLISIVVGPKRDEVTGEWRKLHNEELRDLYSSAKYN